MHRKQSRCAWGLRSQKNRRFSGPALVQAVFDVLENRRMMSSSVSFTNGILMLQGDATAGTSLTVSLVQNGTAVDADAGGKNWVAPISAVKGINISGGSGADYIFVDTRLTVPTTLSGGNGNDTLLAGGGTNTITDGNGSDYISGQEGSADSITVGNGNDTLLGGAGNDTFAAGSGNDSIDGGNGNDELTAGNGNDTITGDAGNDTIIAGNGLDSLNGGLGNDQITVGTGLSTLIPGSGTNAMTSGNKSDTVVQSAGPNTIDYVTGAVSPGTSTGSSAGSSSGTSSSGASSSGASGSSTTSSGSSTNPSTSPANSIATGSSVTINGATWTAYTATPGAGTHPTAEMDVLSAPFDAGIAVDVRGLDSTLGSGSVINADYQWNFGDPTGEYNQMTGFNASHIYSRAGTYTVSLTVTNSLNETSTVWASVVIAPDTRRAIYVDSVDGNDKNNGLTPGTAVQSAARADALVGNNTEVFFDRGETFNLSAAFKLNFSDVLVGAYGSGAQPVLNYTDPVEGSVILTTNSTVADGVTIQDLTLTSLNAAGTGLTTLDPPMGINAGGSDTSVVGCTFDYVEYAVNGNSAPVGLNLFDNSSPSATGLLGYFLWDQGTDTTVVGNTAAGSVNEHILRTSSASEINVADNNFTNSDGKGCIEIHEGGYAWINGNTVNGGDIRVGPLGLWGEPVTSSTDDSVIENNQVNDTAINVFPGAHSISIRNNVIRDNSGQMIDVRGQDSDGRQSSDIEILNNTGISSGTTGNFLIVESHVDGILLENNLLVEPNMVVGGYSSAPVYVNEANLSSFTYINGNVWQEPATITPFAEGGINYVGEVYTSTGYLTPAEWDDLSVVGNDFFYNVVIDSSTGAPAVGSPIATIDGAVAGVYGDINGAARPTSGAWTAGAVQV